MEIKFDILSNLPLELSQTVILYLDHHDLSVCWQVCKQWREIVNYNKVWRRICYKFGWYSTDMVDDFRSHHYSSFKESLDLTSTPLYSPCKWNLNFQRHYVLPRNWQNGKTTNYKISFIDSSVTSISCDGNSLCLGYANGFIAIFDVISVPKYKTSQLCVLDNYRVVKSRIYNDYVVCVQSRLVQLYKFNSNGYYKLIDCKSFDSANEIVEIFKRVEVRGDEFCDWYKKLVKGDRLSKGCYIFCEIFNDKLYATARDISIIYVWNLQDGSRSNTIHTIRRKGKMRDFILHGNNFYIIYAEQSARYVAIYDLISDNWTCDMSTPNIKTQKLLCESDFLIGIGITGAGIIDPGRINVWNKINGQLYTFQSVKTFISHRTCDISSCGFIFYAEGNTIYVWEPVKNNIYNKFSIGENIVFIKATPFQFLLIYTHSACTVWDWKRGVKLYRIFPELQWNGDYRDLIWINHSMIICKGDNNNVEMTCFI